jgi:hypothetical protein
MEERFIENAAPGIPFAGILTDLLTENLGQHAEKAAVFGRMRGSVAIVLEDIEAAVTLIFTGGRLTIAPEIAGRPAIVIRTTSDCVIDLNALKVMGGLPCYFDAAGRRVLGHLLAGRLTIAGMFTHPILLTRLTKIMSVT